MNRRALLKSALRLIDITAAAAMDWALEDGGCYPAMSAQNKKRLRRGCLSDWHERVAGQGAPVAWALCFQKEEALCERASTNQQGGQKEP